MKKVPYIYEHSPQKYIRYLQKTYNENGDIKQTCDNSMEYQPKVYNKQPFQCKSGTDFENWVQAWLTGLGFDARLTGSKDNGVDIIATITLRNKEYKYYIQCKFYNSPVDRKPIQEVYTGRDYYSGDGYPVVITNNKMTSGTRAFAKKMGVELITELEFNEFELTVKQKKILNESHRGLMGIRLAKFFGDKNLMYKVLDDYEKKQLEVTEITDREKLKQELIDNFNQAQILMQEYAEH